MCEYTLIVSLNSDFFVQLFSHLPSIELPEYKLFIDSAMSYQFIMGALFDHLTLLNHYHLGDRTAAHRIIVSVHVCLMQL